MKSPSNGQFDQSWNELAPVYAASREVSPDKLIEWPAQLRLAGDFRGKRVLHVGCGTGDKTRYFAEHGAMSALVSMEVAGLRLNGTPMLAVRTFN
jgi:ubiquinone/menaquinone biosynthesis C-methylase UbiE